MDVHPRLCKCLACVEAAAALGLVGGVVKSSSRDDFTFVPYRSPDTAMHAEAIQRDWDRRTPPGDVGFELSPVGNAGTATAAAIYVAMPPDAPVEPIRRFICVKPEDQT